MPTNKLKDNQPYFFALTGVIGSGKSYVADRIKSYNHHVITADELARLSVAPNSPGLNEVKELFLSEVNLNVIKPDGTLDRQKVATIVFSNTELKLKLEAILHPKIRQLFDKALTDIRKIYNPDKELIFYDVPLFFEVNYKHPQLLGCVLVVASKQTCIERIIKRDLITADEALKRIESQKSIQEKINRSDYLILNDSQDRLNNLNIPLTYPQDLSLEAQIKNCQSWCWQVIANQPG